MSDPAFLGEVTPLMLLWRLVRLELMERLGLGRIDSVLETRRRLRWVR